MKKDLRCPLGKSSNELVVSLKIKFLLKVVAVPSGCVYEERSEVPLGKVKQ